MYALNNHLFRFVSRTDVVRMFLLISNISLRNSLFLDKKDRNLSPSSRAKYFYFRNMYICASHMRVA